MCFLRSISVQWILMWMILYRYIGITHGDGCFTKITLDDTEQHEITSPGYPNIDPTNTNCTWQIDIKKYHQGMTIRLILETVDLENSDDCSSQYVKFVSNTTLVENQKDLAVICGQQQKTFDFFMDTILIVYKSDANETDQRLEFRLSYQMQNVSSCSGSYSGAGQIKSPGFDAGIYHSFQRCTYLFEAKSINNVMELSITFFINIRIGNCSQEYILIYAGKTEDSSLIGRHCGDGHISPGLYKHFYIVFVSRDNPYDQPGLTVRYKEEPCGGELDVTVQESEIEFPGDSYPFTGKIRCAWSMRTRYELHKVVVTFTDTNFNCAHGTNVVIYDGPSRLSQDWSFCDSKEHMFLSTGTRMHITLSRESNTQIPLQFVMHYKGELVQVCGKERAQLIAYGYATEPLQSPEFPLRYPDHLNCVWEINAALTAYKVKLIMEKVYLDAECYDTLSFYNGQVENFAAIKPDKRYCGHNIFYEVETFLSQGSMLTVHFISNGVDAGEGFKIYYQSSTGVPDYVVAPVSAPTSINGAVIGLLVGTLGIVIVVVLVALVCVIKRRRLRNQPDDHVYTATRDPSIPSLVSMRGSMSDLPPSYQEVSSETTVTQNGGPTTLNGTTTDNGTPTEDGETSTVVEHSLERQTSQTASLPPTYSEALLNNMIQVEWF